MDTLQSFGTGIALALALLVVGLAVAVLFQLVKIRSRLPRLSRRELSEARRSKAVTEELMRQGFTEAEAQEASDETTY